MPAYSVARSKSSFIEYKITDLVPDIIAKFGGKVMARGIRALRIMEGPDKSSASW